MRNMSFMLTTEQIRAGQKTVTRRLGWQFLNPGDLVMACVKCMGLKRGEQIEKIRPIRILDVSRVPLAPISKEEVTKEGFPEESGDGFVAMFMQHMKCRRDTLVTRIEFEYVYKCAICHEYLPLSEMSGEVDMSYGHVWFCKKCDQEIPF